MLPPSRSAARTGQAAQEAEAAGMEGVFSFELATNPWASLGAVAATTSSIRLASGIALALARSPYDTALAALDLDALSPRQAHEELLNHLTTHRGVYWTDTFINIMQYVKAQQTRKTPTNPASLKRAESPG